MHRLHGLLQRLPAEIAERISSYDDPVETWLAIERADLLLWTAIAARVDRRLVVACALELAEHAVRIAKCREPAAMRALAATRAWLSGAGTSNEAWAAALTAVQGAASDGSDASAAARAAACAAFACDERADDAFYAHAGYAAHAAEHALLTLDDRLACEIVRQRVATGDLLEALERVEPPPIEVELFERSEGFYA